jgi:hypothetical protein
MTTPEDERASPEETSDKHSVIVFPNEQARAEYVAAALAAAGRGFHGLTWETMRPNTRMRYLTMARAAILACQHITRGKANA